MSKELSAEKMKVVVLAMGGVFFLTACAAPTVGLQEPQTGARAACHSLGVTGERGIEKCIREYEGKGFRKRKDMSPEEQRRLSPRAYLMLE